MPDESQPHDEEIIRRILQGRHEDFRLLMDRHMRMLFGFALHLTGDHDVAADLAQESFIDAYQSLDRLRNPRGFSAWLVGILRNKARNHRRGLRRRPLSLESLRELGFEPANPGPSAAEAEAFSDEYLAAVLACVEALPEKYREIVMLRYVQDCSYKAIAEALGLPVTTVTMRLTYARRLLLAAARRRGLL